MDSFIDKLAQKFTAQEIIKANSSAEAAELKRAREQVQQYEVCLEEMKTVNESMKESLAKLEQTLSLDLEKFGQMQIPTDDISAVIAENMNALKATQNEAKLQQDLAQEQMSGQLRDIQDKLSGQLAGQIQSIQDCVSGQLGEQLQGMQSNMAGLLYDQMQGVKGNMAEQIQGIQGAQYTMAEQVQGIQENVSGQLQGIREQQDKLNGQMLGQMQDMQQVQEAQEKLSIQITGQLHAVQDKILQQMRAERALIAASQEEGNKFSEAQIAVLKEQSNAQLESLKAQLDGQLESQLGTQKEQIADYVHKENVKVYRNVQAVVVDETGKQIESMNSLVNKVMAKNQMMMRLVIASVACSGLSFAAALFLILHSLGIF